MTLSSNDPNNSKMTLRLEANVLVGIDVKPRESVYFKGRPGEIEAQKLDLIASNGAAFAVTELELGGDSLDVSIEPAPDKALKDKDGKTNVGGKKPAGAIAGGNSAYTLTVNVKPDAAIGQLSQSIAIKTDHPKSDSLKITARGRLEGNVTVLPQQVFFLTQRAKEDPSRLTRRVSIKATSGSMSLGKLEAPSGFEVKSNTVEEGKEFSLEVKYTGSLEKQDAIRDKLVVHTSDKRQPKIEIPLHVRF